MKKCVSIFLAAFAVILAVTGGTVSAEDIPGYGTKVIIDYDAEQFRPEEFIGGFGTGFYAEDSAAWSLYSAYTMIPHRQFMPVWSPDGKWIATRNFISNTHVWIVPADGGMPTSVYNSNYHYNEYYVSHSIASVLGFTADSREVLFSGVFIDEEKGSTVDITLDDNGEYVQNSKIVNGIQALMAVDIETGESRVIAENISSGFNSNTGRYYAYYNTNSLDLQLLDTDNNSTTTLLENQSVGSITFSPDDSYIRGTIYDNKSKTTTIHRIELDGSGSEQVSAVEIPGKANLSPDGKLAAYTDLDDESKILVMDIETETVTLVTPGMDDAMVLFKCWSPDSSKLAFTLDHDDGNQIFVKDLKEYDFANPVAVESEKPSALTLETPFPNPFNPATTISFSLAESNFTELSVHNITGQKIRTLASGMLSAGQHSIVWDGMNENGMPVSSGLYFTRLESGGMAKTARMTLMK